MEGIPPRHPSCAVHPDRRSDLHWSVVWIALGMAIFHGGWTMDRLEQLNINPYTAPGLVPAALGIGIALLGLALLARSLRARRSTTNATTTNATADDPGADFSLSRLLIALALCLTYGAALVGRGMPFWLATFLFVFVSIAVLQWAERGARNERLRGLVVAAACAAATAIAVTIVFQELFLVRLP